MLALVPFQKTEKSIQSVLQFCRSNPVSPIWPEHLIQRFLTELSSSPQNVLDVRQNGVRIAVGVLVDQISNAGNLACMELIGASSKIPLKEVYAILTANCPMRIPPHKNGFQISVRDDEVMTNEFFSTFGLRPFYESFDMECETLANAKPSTLDGIEVLNEEDQRALYEVARETGMHSPDIAIPDFENWRTSINTPSTQGRTWVKKISGKIVGYLRIADVHHPDRAEIRIVGVSTEFRRRGIGRALICHALQFALEQGCTKCRLSVATENERALNLYKSLGFKTREHFRVFRSN